MTDFDPAQSKTTNSTLQRVKTRCYKMEPRPSLFLLTVQKIFTITLTQFKLIQQSSLLLLAALIASKEQGLQSRRLGYIL